MNQEPPLIAAPVANPRKPRIAPSPGAWDAHAHVMGPPDTFPYAEGRGYTPADVPAEKFVALLDHLGFAHGLVVQGNAHGYDNRVIFDALARYPDRLRGVVISDTRVPPQALRAWDKIGVRGMRYHLFSDAGKPGYVRGVGLDVFDVFRKTMADLGWAMQVFCDCRLMAELAPALRDIAREMPVIVDHMLHLPAARGVNDPNFQALLKLVGDGDAYVKLSGNYRLSSQFPDYADARPFHDALVAANPDRLMWGTDWPHTSIAASAMPDDGHLLDLFYDWTPDENVRQKILVDTPQRLFGR